MTVARRTKLTIAAGVAVMTLGLFALMAAGSHVTQSQAAGCANAKAKPNEATVKEFRKAIVCLIQKERAQRGIPTLRKRQGLQSVAQKHSKVMVNQDCFRHTCSGEAGLKKRLVRSGYLKGADAYAYGELIGYEATPRRMVNAWLDSGPHRGRMFSRRYAHIGGGAAKGAPVEGKPDSAFVTYTVIFGDVKR